MASLQITSPPAVEPLSLAQVKLELGYGPWEDSDHVTSKNLNDKLRPLIVAARQYCSMFTRRCFISTGFAQYLDSFPYYTDTLMSQQAYPPAYYSLPRYSTTLWNYSQMIKLIYSPCLSVQNIQYIDTNGDLQTLLPGLPGNQKGDFVVDNAAEPGRLFPNAGQYWPPVLYVPNAVCVNYTAGWGTDLQGAATASGGKLAMVQVAMRLLIKKWHGDPSLMGQKSPEVDRLLWGVRVLDWASTRG
jgi:hypothetical protein